MRYSNMLDCFLCNDQFQLKYTFKWSVYEYSIIEEKILCYECLKIDREKLILLIEEKILVEI
jgi:hypothetical protein